MNSKTKKHFFSVIVLGYNIEKFIGDCLDSVLSQTYNNFEVIIIDDGSTDGTSNICKQYEKKDSRVHYHFQNNAGTTTARVKGYSLAKGDYVIALDGDDTVNENWLETINECLAEKEYDCVFYNFYNWENGKYKPSNNTFPKQGEIEPVEMIKNVIETRNHPLWDKAFKRELALSCNSIAKTLPKLSMNNDTIHIFYILANMKSPYICDKYLMNYRIIPKSASHGFKLRNISDALLSMYYTIDALKNDEKNINEYKKLLLISLLKMISFRLPMLYFSNTAKNEKKAEIKKIYNDSLYKESKKYEKLKNLNLKEFVFLKVFRWHVPFMYIILKAIHKVVRFYKKAKTKQLNYIYIIANKISYKLRKKNAALDKIALLFLKLYFSGVQKFLKKNFSHLLNTQPESYTSQKKDNNIFVCWFQGENNAPDIVKCCIQSIRKAAPKKSKVIILNEDNMLDYAKIPSTIIEKYKNGLITKTNFSDILRFALLSQKGGAWMDSTIFCSESINPELFNYQLYSIKNSNYDKFNIARRKWTAYFWFAKQNSYFARRAFQFFCSYWEKCDTLIDYFLVDHIIYFLYKNDPLCKEMLDLIPANNPNVSFLQDYLSKEFETERWNSLKEDTCFFKLNWKSSIANENDNTFYKKIICKELS